MRTKPTFKIGLCMAGAVSAGAYTAGVVDYLFEVLNRWEERKENKIPGTPSHNVMIDVIGGASAGGMTAVIAAASALRKFNPVTMDTPEEERCKNPLYDSWVNMTGGDVFLEMLKTDDITDSTVYSLMNSLFIDRIAEKALAPVVDKRDFPQYLSPDLKFFTTLTNTSGFEYSAWFNPGTKEQSQYRLKTHRDFACFRMARSNEVSDNNGWIPVDFASGLNAKTAMDAAMSTGAFPVGLKARKLTRQGEYLNRLDWYEDVFGKKTDAFATSYTSLNIDGGVIDNEPFELIRKELAKSCIHCPEGSEMSFDHFSSTTIMVDPFPMGGAEASNKSDLISIVMRTIGVMLDESRNKPSLIYDAMDVSNASRFLISPVRYVRTDTSETKISDSRAIACGALGGFSGFFSKDFREHDFFLGRLNCEKFLRDYLTVPIETTNEIFTEGYEGLVDEFAILDEQTGKRYLPVIPIFPESTYGFSMPRFRNKTHWPSISKKEVEGYSTPLKNRIDKMFSVLFPQLISDAGLAKISYWIIRRSFLNNLVKNRVIDMLLDAFHNHGVLGR